MDIINADWVERVNFRADQYQDGYINITEFTNDELQYLVYWNFGISGAAVSPWAKDAMAQLKARGVEYSQEHAEKIEALAEQYY